MRIPRLEINISKWWSEIYALTVIGSFLPIMHCQVGPNFLSRFSLMYLLAAYSYEKVSNEQQDDTEELVYLDIEEWRRVVFNTWLDHILYFLYLICWHVRALKLHIEWRGKSFICFILLNLKNVIVTLIIALPVMSLRSSLTSISAIDFSCSIFCVYFVL